MDAYVEGIAVDPNGRTTLQLSADAEPGGGHFVLAVDNPPREAAHLVGTSLRADARGTWWLGGTPVADRTGYGSVWLRPLPFRKMAFTRRKAAQS